jgi:hypothetical protein
MWYGCFGTMIVYGFCVDFNMRWHGECGCNVRPCKAIDLIVGMTKLW